MFLPDSYTPSSTCDISRTHGTLSSRDRSLDQRGISSNEVLASLRTRYTPRPSIHSVQPAQDAGRILFVGSSQTFGAGAQDEAGTFVSLIEQRLNQSGTNRYQCINAGLSACDSSEILPILESEWLGLIPQIVVIDLSNNDKNQTAFALNQDRMVELCLGRGSKVLLVMEANSIEADTRNTMSNHEIMKQVAAARRVPVLDLHTRLAERFEDGFIWWDSVHLTPYGHQLAAALIGDELEPLLKP